MTTCVRSDALTGSVALVTGGGAGIGQSICQHFAGAGAAVGVLDCDGPSAERTVRLIEDNGGRAIHLIADVSDERGVAEAFQRVHEQLGLVTILVNNAGIYPMLRWRECDLKQWDRHMAVNLRGCYVCARLAIPDMKASAGGVIINIGSVTFHLGSGNSVAYVASKGGVIGLTRELADELGPANIRVNCITPGFIETDANKQLMRQGNISDEHVDEIVRKRQCLKRLLVPEDVAKVALFLATSDSDAMTGQVINVDGGMVKY